jgi:hypothetical protein
LLPIVLVDLHDGAKELMDNFEEMRLIRIGSMEVARERRGRKI